MTEAALEQRDARPMTAQEKRVIVASSAGTVVEWYDFFVYGSMAATIAKNFYSNVNPTAAYILALLTFAAGFAARPFGALLFGQLGDLFGRKYAFILTILIMGTSTFLIGLLPDFDSVGIAAPMMLVALRMTQGLALGGEYSGAAVFVGEHAPERRRGFYTSWIQTTASLGLLLSLIVILGVRGLLGKAEFEAFGWRIPFLLSFVLLAASIWMRLKLRESEAFRRMKANDRGARRPLFEAFGYWNTARMALIALFGGTAGQAVVWYTGQFYALFFLTQELKVDHATADLLVAAALVIGAPFFVLFGWLSDRVGRKPIILGGCLLAAALYFPIFKGLTVAANPALAQAQAAAPVRVIADPASCAFQFDPVENADFRSSCDVAKNVLANAGVSYANEAAPAGALARVAIGRTEIAAFEGAGLSREDMAKKRDAFEAEVKKSIAAAGYPLRADPARVDKPKVLVLLTLLIILGAMTYGPIAAQLVEFFPTRIRSTAVALPYHLGNGWFGGILPPLAFAMVAASGNIYSGLWYPIGVALMTFVVGLLLVPETRDRDIFAID